jgi:hypothetical protein
MVAIVTTSTIRRSLRARLQRCSPVRDVTLSRRGVFHALAPPLRQVAWPDKLSLNRSINMTAPATQRIKAPSPRFTTKLPLQQPKECYSPTLHVVVRGAEGLQPVSAAGAILRCASEDRGRGRARRVAWRHGAARRHPAGDQRRRRRPAPCTFRAANVRTSARRCAVCCFI